MNTNNSMSEWIIVGLMAVGIAGGTALTDVDPVVALHDTLATNTEDSFDTAKKHLYTKVDPVHGKIRCVYSDTFAKLEEQSNGTLKPPTSEGVQVEHTWASKAKWVGLEYHFERDSVPGADLHHLFAVRRGINASRGNHPFGVLPSTARELRVNDDGKLNKTGGGTASGSRRDKNQDGVVIFQPRADHRGNVARAMFYMSVRYWLPITDKMEQALRQWHEDDPVDQDEEARNDRIQNIQGNRNPFIDDPDLVETVDDY